MKQQVFTKARQRFGTFYPAQLTQYVVEIVKNKSIDIYKDNVLVNSFNLGDTAEYNSYNLHIFLFFNQSYLLQILYLLKIKLKLYIIYLSILLILLHLHYKK